MVKVGEEGDQQTYQTCCFRRKRMEYRALDAITILSFAPGTREVVRETRKGSSTKERERDD